MSVEQPIQQPPLPSDNLIGSVQDRLLLIQSKMAAMPIPSSSPVSEKTTLREKIEKMKFLFLGIAVLILSPLVTWYMFQNPQSGQTVFEISEPVIVGPSDLCPGDSLIFQTNATVKEAGVYRLAMSTWKIAPLPATYAFSDGLDMVMAESRDFPIKILWLVPSTFDNLATGKKEPWPPGEYSRDISVTATGRNTSSEPRQVKFVIREDCPNRAASYHDPLYSNP